MVSNVCKAMSSTAKSLLFSAVVVNTSLFVPAVALAANGEGDHHAPHVENWWGALSETNAEAPALGWMMVTFATFLAILYASIRRPLTTYLSARSDEVRHALEEAKQARAEAEAKAREYEERLANLDAEVDALKQDFRARGEAELRRLEQAGKATAERIAKDAEDTIAAEMDRAQQALKQEAAKLSLEMAEETLRGAIGSDDHHRLEKAFLADVARP